MNILLNLILNFKKTERFNTMCLRVDNKFSLTEYAAKEDAYEKPKLKNKISFTIGAYIP